MHFLNKFLTIVCFTLSVSGSANLLPTPTPICCNWFLVQIRFQLVKPFFQLGNLSTSLQNLIQCQKTYSGETLNNLSNRPPPRPPPFFFWFLLGC